MPGLPFPGALQSARQALKRLMTAAPRPAALTVGLDIGSTSIKVIALGARNVAGPRPIVAQGLVPVEAGHEADASQGIKTALGQLQRPIREVNVGVSGQWVIIRIVEMPTMSAAEMRQALPFEAQRQLPFNLQDVVIDGVVLGPAAPKKSWVLVVACKKELVQRRVEGVKRAGVEVALVDVDALALANGFLAGSTTRPEGTHALVNIGAQLTNLVIFHGAIPYLVRDIPWGAEKLIRSAAEQAGVEASAVRQALGAEEVRPDVFSALKVSSEVLVTEIQLSFDYFENQFGHPPADLLVSGGLGQSGSFLQALKSHLAQPVTPWTPVKELSGQFAVAYGLALRTT